MYLAFLFIGLGSIWVMFHDNDDVHTLAASLIASFTLLFCFILSPLLIKVPLVLIILLIFRKFEAKSHS